jgi:hypothetical protein
LCCWNEILSEEEYERAAGDPHWEHYLETLVKARDVKKTMQNLISGHFNVYNEYKVCEFNFKGCEV